jgi:hypothetical protein
LWGGGWIDQLIHVNLGTSGQIRHPCWNVAAAVTIYLLGDHLFDLPAMAACDAS